MELVSDDNRRSLYEIGNGGTWKVCKYLVVKSNCTIGDHFHLNKDEEFAFIKGGGSITIDNVTVDMYAPFSIQVKRGTYHKFIVMFGTEIICLASEEHDPNDDHK